MRLTKFLDESINDKAIFKSCFVSGNPGAGKSYILQKINSGSLAPRVINTDIYTEYFGNGGNVENWAEMGPKIEKISLNKLHFCINSMLPLWIDSTSSSPSNTIRRLSILESFGYETSMVWVNTSLETSLKRNAQRKRKVPEDFLIDVYNKAQKVKPVYKSKFKYFWEINNDDGEFTDAIMLKAFKAVTSFYTRPLNNILGQLTIEKLKKQKGKYLEDLPQWKDKTTLKKQLENWFN